MRFIEEKQRCASVFILRACFPTNPEV